MQIDYSNIHPECLKCIAARQAKFGNKANDVDCTGIPLDPLKGLANLDTYTDEEKQELRMLLDPTEWARRYINVVPRWYQDIMIRCTATRKMSRTGRRVGKTFSMALASFHYAFTHEHRKILLIAPLEGPLKEIFKVYDEWVANNPILRQSMSRRRSNPETLEFTNGSRILGLSAGSKSGMGASNVRGQEADIIFLDEADYLEPKDIEAILPLLQKTNENTDEKKVIWASSTPTGKHQFFWGWAQDSQFKEFHYPANVNPNWTIKDEVEWRSRLGATGYDHEILAEWGEEMEGVYQTSYIDRAKELSTMFFEHGEWSYKTQEPIEGCIYIIGVDWNSSKNGVQIVVVEHNPSLKMVDDIKSLPGRYRIATRSSIDSKEFTQTKAIEEIIRLNETWRPAYIYVDQGYGQTQIEDLKRWGHAHPASGIVGKLKGIDSGSSTITRDPLTKAEEKKPTKPFMVNNSVLFFENNVILLNKSDKEFEDQLQDYRVEKRSRDGRPVYTAGNDHVLDAFNLAMLAFTMEFTDLGRVLYASSMRMVGPLGEKQQKERDIASMVPRNDNKSNGGIKPRDIPRDEAQFFKTRRFWETGRYRSSKFNKPIKRQTF